jgi:hypothetical protein
MDTVMSVAINKRVRTTRGVRFRNESRRSVHGGHVAGGLMIDYRHVIPRDQAAGMAEDGN